MAVKFSEFTAKLDASVDVTEVVGYLQTGELNVRIPPANLDTTYVVSTGNAGASPTINLQGTKPNQAAAIAPTTVSLTGSGATLLAGNGTTTIDFGSTAYALTSTDSVVGNNSVPVVLTGTGGNDVGTDTVTIVGTGNIQVSSATNVITINGTSSTNTTYTLPAGGTSSAATLTLTGSDSSSDLVTLTGGTGITFSSITDGGFTIDAASSGGFGSIFQTTGTGSALSVTLPTAPTAAQNCLVSISGVTQNLLDASGNANWTVTGTTFAFTTSPPVTSVNAIQIIVIA